MWENWAETGMVDRAWGCCGKGGVILLEEGMRGWMGWRPLKRLGFDSFLSEESKF